MELPSGFVDVARGAEMELKKQFNVIGIVVDFMPPALTRRGEWMFTFSIRDSGYGNELKIRFFNKDQQKLPPITSNGDIILIRILNHVGHQGVAISKESTSCIVFPGDKIPDKPSEFKTGVSQLLSGGPKPTLAEHAYVVSLHRSSGVDVPPNPEQRSVTKRVTPAPDAVRIESTIASEQGATHSREKFSLIRDVSIKKFVDLLVEVVKVYPTSFDRTELYVTDYTEHDYLYKWAEDNEGRAGDEYGYSEGQAKEWRGPWGRRILQVCLFDQNAVHFNKFKDNKFLQLKNVRIKQGKDGQGRIDAAMHGDRQFPDRQAIFAVEMRHKHAQELLQRRHEYWEQAKLDGLRCPDETNGSKKRSPETLQEGEKEKKRSKKNNAKTARVDSNMELKPLTSNIHVKSSHESQPIRSLHDVLHDNKWHDIETPEGVKYRLPFQNVKYRVNLKVVDFLPHNLEDFASPKYESEYENAPIDEASDSEVDSPQNETSWEWRFKIIVENGSSVPKGAEKEKLEIQVFHRDAEYLLSLDAVDLRQNPTTLNKLREKLFILWGDLEEIKSASTSPVESILESSVLSSRDQTNGAVQGQSKLEALPPSAKPFVCCIKEYGVHTLRSDCSKTSRCELDHWDRKFQMWGTRIM